jgi:tRNA-dihydrouridine synthase B
VRSTARPVLAKIRSGWEVGSENAVEIARLLEQCGVAAIAVHGRTRAQMFAGRADWGVIAAVKRAVVVPVIGNGDIWSGPDARRMVAETGCDLVMAGRGALGNPWLFAEINACLGEAGGAPDVPHAVGWGEKLETIREHFALMIADKGESRAIREMRKHLGWYIKGIAGAAHARRDIMTATTQEQVFTLLARLAG